MQHFGPVLGIFNCAQKVALILEELWKTKGDVYWTYRKAKLQPVEEGMSVLSNSTIFENVQTASKNEELEKVSIQVAGFCDASTENPLLSEKCVSRTRREAGYCHKLLLSFKQKPNRYATSPLETRCSHKHTIFFTYRKQPQKDIMKYDCSALVYKPVWTSTDFGDFQGASWKPVEWFEKTTSSPTFWKQFFHLGK